MLCFDIETGPLPDDQLPAFDRDAVSIPSNYKDPAKIEAKKDEAEAAWREKLALSPLTGRVVAIGWIVSGDTRPEIDGIEEGHDERGVLARWWNLWLQFRSTDVCGFNIVGFDLPFLYQRSLLLDVPMPSIVIDRRGYWHESFVDLMHRWTCDRRSFVKLDVLCKAMGLPGKTDGVEGKDFHKLWETDRAKATEYLCDDVTAVKQLAERMGV